MNYFVGEANQQRGPFTLEQLRARGLRPDTLVWREGMAQWQPAGTIPELQLIFSSTPYPVGYNSQPNPPPLDSSKRILAGLMGIFLGPLGIHKFILGFTGAGLVYLLVTFLTCGFGGIVMHILGIIEGIIYLCKSDAEFHQIYVVERRSWF